MSKYQIEHNRYMELKYFCKQYDYWKDCCDAIDGFPKANFSRGNNSKKVSDPVTFTVEQREEYLHKMELIENAAKLADDELSSFLILAVTKGFSYYGLRAYCNMKACKTKFYESYGRFFFILDKTRK